MPQAPDVTSKIITLQPAPQPSVTSAARIVMLTDRFKSLGADKYDMLLPETHALPYIIHPDEAVLGLVYGRYKQVNSVGPNTYFDCDSNQARRSVKKIPYKRTPDASHVTASARPHRPQRAYARMPKAAG